MENIMYLHEAALLYNLKDRHAAGKPFTKVGDIIMITNPYYWNNELYTEEMKFFHANRILFSDKASRVSHMTDDTEGMDKHDPHIYEISSRALKGIAVDGTNQSILVTGNSGAGKTEATKLVACHLAYIQEATNATDHSRMLMAKLVDASDVIEAFGNARTITNDNSSRFGKFTQMHYDVEDKTIAWNDGRSIPNCSLARPAIKTYLLEKSRVVGHDKGERSFHIFYRLMAAPEDFKTNLWEKGLSNSSASSFQYLTAGGVHDDIDEYTDGDSWMRMVASLETLGLTGDNLMMILKIVCMVLQLGNLEFGPDPNNDEETVVTSVEELDKAADVFGVSAETMTKALIKRKIKLMKETVDKSLSPDVAKDNCDALAKDIYDRMCSYLIKLLNDSMESNDPDSANKQYKVISVLDIYGFELLGVNRFEQFCINYTNEKLQQKYVSDVVFAAAEEFVEEGVSVFDASQVDNSAILELLEGHAGLIPLLNDECIRPKGSAVTYVYKLKSVHKKSRWLISEPMHQKWEFGVRHFADPVKYDAKRFIERNTDSLPLELVNLVSSCSNQLLVDNFQSLADSLAKQVKEGRLRTRSNKNSVISKFQTQVHKLLDTIGNSRAWYVRCITPNGSKKPFLLDQQMVITQIRSACIETAITISRETFVNQATYAHILGRFRNLSEVLAYKKTVDERAETKQLLAELLSGRERTVGGQILQPYECGATKVFFRAGMLEILEAKRTRVFGAIAIVVQRWIRCSMGTRRYQELRTKLILMQAWQRGNKSRHHYRKQLNGALMVQCLVRVLAAREELKNRREYKAAMLFQAAWRMYQEVRSYKKCTDAIAIMQRAVRKSQDRSNLTYSLVKCIKDARWNKRLNVLRNSLEEFECDNMDDSQKNVMNECQEMLTYFKYKVYELRGTNANLLAEMKHKQNAASLAGSQIGNANIAMMVNSPSVQRDPLRKSVRASRKASIMSSMVLNFDEFAEDELSRLRSENRALQKENSNLKNEMNNRDAEHEKELNYVQDTFSAEVDKLKDELEKKDEAFEMKKTEIENDLMQSHERKVLALKRNLDAEKSNFTESMGMMFDALHESTSFHVGNTEFENGIESGDDTKKQILVMNAMHERKVLEMKQQLAEPCPECGAVRVLDSDDE